MAVRTGPSILDARAVIAYAASYNNLCLDLQMTLSSHGCRHAAELLTLF